MSTRDDPGDPGCPAVVWADTEHGEIEIAMLNGPMYLVDPVDEYDHGFRSDGDVNANARLIAAAPDLLAALEAVEWIAVPAGYGSFDLECPWCDMRKSSGHTDDCQRQTAIAKARGESQ